MNQSTNPEWMEDELVKDIPEKKLEFLGNLFTSGKGKTQKEMMSFLIPMMKKAKSENLTFTQSEVSACIQAIKKHSSEEELEQINSLLKKASVK